MIKQLCIAALLAFSATSFAQTQQGIVKTRGRMINGKNVPGKGLPNALVAVKGCSKVLTQSNGTFSFPTPSQTFTIDSVKKKGYQLVDADATRHPYRYSPNKLYLVMDTPEQQMEDLLDAQENINRTLQDNLRKARAELKKLREEKKISDDEYLQRIDKLMEEQNKSQKLVEEMAKEYAAIDYDQLEGINRRICDAIAHGRLLEADSLLRSKGDMNSRKNEIDIAKQVEEQRAAEIAKEQEQLEVSKAGTQRKIIEFGEDCYRYYERFKLAYNNDSAAHYLALRVSVDSTNVEWLFKAGYFNKIYLSDYKKALKYFEIGLQQSMVQYGEMSDQTSNMYNSIGLVYDELADIEKALYYHNKSLSVSKQLYGDNSPKVATSYLNIGATYESIGQLDKALELYNKALAIFENEPENARDLSTIYNNISLVYLQQNEYVRALELCKKAIAAFPNGNDDYEYNVAGLQNSLGTIYCTIGKYTEALECCNTALKLALKVFGKNHTIVANIYNELGIIYENVGKFEKSTECLQNSLSVYNTIYGSDHPKTAKAYDNLGTAYGNHGDESNAFECFIKALNIREKILEPTHPDLASSYNNLGGIYFNAEEYEKAIEYHNKSLAIREKIYGVDNANTADSYNNLGAVYHAMKQYDKALVCFNKTLRIRTEALGLTHPSVAKIYENLATLYNSTGQSDQALDAYHRALDIYANDRDHNLQNISTTYQGMGFFYYKNKDANNALVYFEKAYEINREIWGENHEKTFSLKQIIDKIRFVNHARGYEEAVATGKTAQFMEDVVITITTVGNDSPAMRQGMSGEYMLLEYSDWNINSPNSIFKHNKEYNGKPKDLLVIKDNNISTHHFDNVIGVNIGFKKVSKEEKQRINKLYEDWKKHNRVTQ